jgi:hypothetical protein
VRVDGIELEERARAQVQEARARYGAHRRPERRDDGTVVQAPRKPQLQPVIREVVDGLGHPLTPAANRRRGTLPWGRVVDSGRARTTCGTRRQLRNRGSSSSGWSSSAAKPSSDGRQSSATVVAAEHGSRVRPRGAFRRARASRARRGWWCLKVRSTASCSACPASSPVSRSRVRSGNSWPSRDSGAEQIGRFCQALSCRGWCRHLRRSGCARASSWRTEKREATWRVMSPRMTCV